MDEYVSKNFERPHYVPLNKNIFDTISTNIKYEAADLVAFDIKYKRQSCRFSCF